MSLIEDIDYSIIIMSQTYLHYTISVIVVQSSSLSLEELVPSSDMS